MLGKKLINAGPVGSSGPTPSNYFNTVLYTGNGGTQRVGGYINRGAVFNGSSSKISLGDFFDFSTESFSISCWVNTASLSSTQCVFSQWSSTSTNRALLATIDTSGNFAVLEGFGSSNNGANAPASTTAISTNTWVHLVYTRSGTEGTIFVNGTEEDRNALSNTITNSTEDFQLGMQESSSKPFNGKIDQVRIFDKALSSGEVTTLYGETHASTTISTTDIFDDNSGVALYQLDGNANDTGGVSGYIGEGAIFNGSSSKIDTGDSIISTGAFSASFWTKLDTLPSASSPAFVSNNSNTGNVGFEVGINYITDKVHFYFGAGSVIVNSNSALVANTWYHIACTYDGTNLKMYIDGNLQTQTSTGTLSAATNNLHIGKAAAFARYIDGKIDEVRIYDKALSSSEVTTLYTETASSNITISDLVAYYPMEGTSLDQEGSYHGTDTNVEYNYSGTASNVTYQDATNFSPDLVWTKGRTTAYDHGIQDSVRGVNNLLYTSLTQAATTTTAAIQSFDSNGFTYGSNNKGNANGTSYVAWCFNAETDAAASNTDGSITSTVKANQDAGFSIVKYTGTSTTATVGHGLSSAPEVVIVKALDRTSSWAFYTTAVDGSYDYIYFNQALAKVDSVISAPTSTLFNVNNTEGMGTNYLTGDYIAYAFHSVDGIQKVGSYTGNGSASGPIVETDFQPQFLMIKNTSDTGDWAIFDNERSPLNPVNDRLMANLSSAESANSTTRVINFMSDGFTVNSTHQDINSNNDTYIYLAIAADPDTTTPTVEDSFEVVTYTGTGSTQSIDTGFKPDLVWIKQRNGTASHSLQDTVRGAGQNYNLYSDNTAYEGQYGIYGYLSSFDTNGFTVEAGSGSHTNANGSTYVAWVFKAGDHDDNLPQINTEGTIDSVVSVNDAAGFSIVKYTGTGALATIGHGLSSAPELFIIKNLDDGTRAWLVYDAINTATNNMTLNTTAASASSSAAYNDTEPTSTVFTVNTSTHVNKLNDDHIAYCFTSIAGYQSVGSYSGGSSGSSNVITTGFKPKFLLVKRTDASGDAWQMFDSIRGGGDTFDNYVQADNSAAEVSYSTREVNFTTNGFYWTNAESGTNISGGTYIYLAIK